MNNKLLKTGERVVLDEFKSLEEYLAYLRHLKAYQFTREFLPHNNRILEIGSGEGYGTSLLAQTAKNRRLSLPLKNTAQKNAPLSYSTETGFRLKTTVLLGVGNIYYDNKLSVLSIGFYLNQKTT